MARYGDCNTNLQMRLSSARIGHLKRWAAIPWCEENGHAPSQVQIADEESGDDLSLVSEAKVGPRRLIGFTAGGDAEVERLRRQILFACC